MRGLPAPVIGLAAAAASALGLFIAGEPLGFGPLAWVALVPLFVVVLRTERRRWSALYGLAFGVVYFGLHLAWIFLFGWMAWTALTLFMALYFVAALLVASVARATSFAPLVLAGAWAGADLLRDRWPVGGYSWGSIGTTQVTVPGVRWLAGVIGVYGLAFLIAFVSALVAGFLVDRRRDWRAVAAVGAVLAVFVGIDVIAYGSPPVDKTLHMTLVQGEVPRPARSDQRERILRSYESLTRGITERADVVVWPEDAVGVGAPPDAVDRVARLAQSDLRPILFGQSVVDPDRAAFLNTVVHMTAGGSVAGVYEKRHPVPFGEYVPFPSWRRFVSTLQSEIPFDLVAGKRAVVFDVDTGINLIAHDVPEAVRRGPGGRGRARIATPICFESVFPRDFLDFARRGAEMYVLATNNASFERSYASEQHLAHSRMRALETRQWIAQAALSGISAFVAPDGRVTQSLPLFESGTLSQVIELRRAHSLYAKTGDLFPAIWAVLAAAGAIFVLVRRRLDSGE